jgi:hypothetical protein
VSNAGVQGLGRVDFKASMVAVCLYLQMLWPRQLRPVAKEDAWFGVLTTTWSFDGLAGHKVYGIESTALVPLISSATHKAFVRDKEAAAAELRYRKLLAGVGFGEGGAWLGQCGRRRQLGAGPRGFEHCAWASAVWLSSEHCPGGHSLLSVGLLQASSCPAPLEATQPLAIARVWLRMLTQSPADPPALRRSRSTPTSSSAIRCRSGARSSAPVGPRRRTAASHLLPATASGMSGSRGRCERRWATAAGCCRWCTASGSSATWRCLGAR